MKCEEQDKSLSDCYKEIAASQDHKQDLIVECYNQSEEGSGVPMDGAVRLVDYNGGPS